MELSLLYYFLAYCERYLSDILNSGMTSYLEIMILKQKETLAENLRV